MPGLAKRKINVKKKSIADTKRDRIESAVKKLGGKEEADRIVLEWENHRRAQDTSERY
jgi:hypothetical protein